jgi:integrase
MRWLDDTVKPTLAPTTHLRYEQIVRLHIIPHLGSVKLAKLEPVHIAHMYSSQSKNGVSVRNQEMSGVVLQKALKNAVRFRLIPHNPGVDVDKPRRRKREMHVWDRDEVTQFLLVAQDDRLYALYVLALTTGMRQGELFALVWGDVDFDHATVTIRRTLEEIRGQFRLKEPKTAASRRQITLPTVALNALHEHRKAMLTEGHATSAVFCDTDGGYLRKSNLARRSFKPLIRRAGVRPIRFHDLRHTHATLLLGANENPKVVSERLGHANVHITLDTYSHVLPNMQKQAAEKLDRLLG